jgi:SAM-dependent methyltransferase
MRKASEFLRRCYPQIQALTGSVGIAETGEALKHLQRGLTGDRILAGKSYFSDNTFMAAYLQYYWPISFLQTSQALEELKLRQVLPDIRNVLDLGAGPGSASFAAKAYGAVSVVMADANAAALNRAAALNDSLPEDMRIALSSLQIDLEEDPPLPQATYDLIVACHSINELWKSKPDFLTRRAALLSGCLAMLSEKGILLIIEPAANSSSRPALALRNILLARLGHSGRPEYECVGPCTGSFACPMPEAAENRTCHSEWMWDPFPQVADLARAAGLDRNSVKATWFALRRASRAPEPPFDQVTAELRGRVVSEPMLNKAGRTRYVICTDSGLVSLSAKAGDPEAKATRFSGLRRGDCLEGSCLEKRQENGYGIVSGSILKKTLEPPDA